MVQLWAVKHIIHALWELTKMWVIHLKDKNDVFANMGQHSNMTSLCFVTVHNIFVFVKLGAVNHVKWIIWVVDVFSVKVNALHLLLIFNRSISVSIVVGSNVQYVLSKNSTKIPKYYVLLSSQNKDSALLLRTRNGLSLQALGAPTPIFCTSVGRCGMLGWGHENSSGWYFRLWRATLAFLSMGLIESKQ